MTGREKLAAAFSTDGAPSVPAVIPYEGIDIRDHQDAFGPPWWYRYAPDIERAVEYYRRVIEFTGQDWFNVWECPSRAEREALVIEPDPGGQRVTRLDRRTGQRTVIEKPRVSGWTFVAGSQESQPESPALTPAALDAKIPAPEEGSPEQSVAEGRWDVAAELIRRYGQTGLPTGYVASPLWRCYGLWGFERLMTLVAEQPELVAYAGDRFLRQAVHSARRQAAGGCAAIWIEECMTDMVSPSAFAELNVPRVRALVDAIRAAGLRSVHYYCGNPADRWEHLLATGADALALEESKKGWAIDIADVVNRVQGRCTVFGNLDAMGLLRTGSEAELQEEIARQIAAGRRNGNRFVMSLGSPVTPETSVARVRRYCDLVHELGRCESAGS